MAKKIINSYYTFDATNDKVVIPGFVKPEELLLITDTTNNQIIYNFADTNRGYDSVSYDDITEKTTVTLSLDVSALSCSDSDNLQIIVDRVNEKIDVADSLLDPVHKIRVSTPENLIDTDFEYGLQPTKWETLETSNNVPSFYVSEGDLALEIVSSIEAINGSDIVTVRTTEEHGLAVGTPIDVQGLSSRTAEGKYLISSADSSGFTYRANAVQNTTGTIGSVYSTVTPGTFYTGSQIPFDVATGLSSNADSNSTITITTESPHGFAAGSNFYLINTVGSKTLTLTNSADSDAPDSRKYVDDSDQTNFSVTPDLTLTETKQVRSRWSTKFNASAVSTANNTITWTGHSLKDNDCVLYVSSSGDTSIGGIDSFDIYFVKVVDSDTIQLTGSYNGSAISFTSTGTYSYGRGSLHLVYEIARTEARYNVTSAYWYTRSNRNGNVGSGWDLNQTINGDRGLGSGAIKAILPIWRTNSDRAIYMGGYYTGNKMYSPRYNSNFVLGQTGTTPSIYNFIEDFSFFEDFNYSSYGYTTLQNYGLRSTKFRYYGNYYDNWTDSVFIIPLIDDDEGDSLYIQNHGLATGDLIDITTNSGSQILVGNTSYNTFAANSNLTDGEYAVTKLSDDRISLQGKTLAQAAGNYTIEGVATNQTKNSFYIANHGFNNGGTVNFTVGAGGTAPSTTSGQILPDYSAGNSSTLPTYHSIIETAVSNYLSANVSTVDIVTANNANSTRVWDSGVSSGNYPVNYYDLYYTTWQIWFSGYGTISIPAANMYLGDLSETRPKNIIEGLSGSTGRSFSMMRSAWSPNTTIPYFMWTAAVDRANLSENWYAYMRDGFYMDTTRDNGAFRIRTSSINQTRTVTASGNNYRYAFNVAAHDYSNGPTMAHLSLKFKNYSDWSSFIQNTYLTAVSDNNRYWYNNDTSSGTYYNRDEIQIGLSFYVTDAESWTPTLSNWQGLINHIIDTFDANAVYPTISSGQNYQVNVINNNRFSLKSNGSEINFTDGGTSPFSFRTEGNLGIVDGSYSANSVTNDTLSIQTNAQVDGATVSVNPTVSGDNLNVADSAQHTFISGTSVVYETDSAGSAFSGLTNGNTYYVSVVDDENFKLADTEEDAVAKNNLLNVTTASGGTQNFKTSSLAGIVQAVGTIATTTGSSVIVGTNTLFRRYFKPGDNIHIKENSSNPGQIFVFTVTTVADDNRLTVDRPLDFTIASTSHFVESKVYARPDGYAIHRPFDGGVEIAAGTAPYSHITRQTRKYFRYQSGKGIQTSLAINFNPPVTFETLTASGTTATATTKYPHRLSVDTQISVFGSTDTTYNGDQTVATIVDDFTFTFTLSSTPVTTIPGGIIKYNVEGYSGAYTRAGMFDSQNGFFFEFDGSTLYCVRRSSTTQLSGTVTASNNSGTIIGVDTNFNGQLTAGDRVVLRGQTYKVVKIDNNSTMHVQPQFRGISTSGAILTKVEDVRVAQDQWNIDHCDGTGPEGFVLNLNKIQMAYMDYSWYGAGKIRFGFKDRDGHVRYVHEFVHNNRLDEAYMRSGNLPAKYEIENGANPTYAPTLFHWGTSVIMDGTFDEDEAYLFTAPSNSLSFTNGDTATATTTANSALVPFYNRGQRTYDWYVRIPFAENAASNFYNGLALYTTGGELDGQEVAFTDYGSGAFRVYIYIQSSRSTPAVYPSVPSATAISLGTPAGTDTSVNLGTDIIPLVSLRLAPSVDGNISGNLGERDIINRMQLKLAEVGMILTHDCEVKLILNPNLSNVNWENVKNPSLSQLIKHNSGDTVTGGTEIFSFRASGGSTDNTGKRLSNSTNFSLAQVIDMGNSILGGNGTFPNGPDVLTVAVEVTDTGGISSDNPFVSSARITWSESQA